MRYTIVGLFLLAACGDVTAPGIACETQKRAELSTRFGSDYSPTDALLRQSHWTFGSTQITWGSDCSKTVH